MARARAKKKSTTASKPIPPTKPIEPSKKKLKCEALDIFDDGPVKLSKLLANVPNEVQLSDVVVVPTGDDYDSPSVHLEWSVEVENEKYEEEYIAYLEKMKKYEIAHSLFIDNMKTWQESESLRKEGLNMRIRELELELKTLKASKG